MTMTTQLYIVMYLLLFAAGIRLRYKKPNVHRPYAVFGGNKGMWLVGGVGFVSTALILLLGFVPPEQLNTGSILFYESFLIIGMLVFIAIPFIIDRVKKPHWKVHLD